MLLHLHLLFPLEVPLEHVADDFIRIAALLTSVDVLTFSQGARFLLVSLQDIEAYVRGLRRRIEVLFVVYGVYLLISFESLLFGLEMLVTIWLHVNGHSSITKTFHPLWSLFL